MTQTLLALDRRASALMRRLGTANSATRTLSVFAASELIWIWFGFLAGLIGARSISLEGDAAFFLPLLLVLVNFAAPLVLAWLPTIALAYVVRRKRPYQAEGFEPLIRMPWETPSFPSGHATYAFALATFTMLAYGHGPLNLFCAALATMIALGRVAVGVHYVSDVLAGAVVGSVVTFLALFGLILVFAS